MLVKMRIHLIYFCIILGMLFGFCDVINSKNLTIEAYQFLEIQYQDLIANHTTQLNELQDQIKYIDEITKTSVYLELQKFVSKEKASEYAKHIIHAGKTWGIDPAIITGLMLRESSGNYKADSGSSVGLMQVNWNVHKDLLRVHFGVNNRNKLFDPKLNILAGSFLLKRYYEDENKQMGRALTRYLGVANSQYKIDVMQRALNIVNAQCNNRIENKGISLRKEVMNNLKLEAKEENAAYGQIN